MVQALPTIPYTPDGSIATDANRGISNIIYNYQGMPSSITFANGRTISNIYDASGSKLSQVDTKNGAITTTDYMGDLIYINDTLQSIRHDEGRILIITPFGGQGANLVIETYQFFIADHLGNTRVIIERGAENTASYQETHYGPWGEILEGLGTKADWRYLYQGKEFIPDLGYDFMARQYDPYLGRFDGIDPVDQYNYSGYMGMNNNPNSYIDPDGKSPALIGALVSAVGYTLSTGFSKGGFSNWDWGKFAMATISGAIMGDFSQTIGTAAKTMTGASKFLFQTVGHSLSAGFNAAANGGNFFTGVKSGAVGNLVGSITNNLPDGLQIASSSIMAGATSKLSGGSFWSGAVQGGIIAGLNHSLHKELGQPEPKPPKSFVSFDGKKLIVYLDGKVIFEAKAYSGRPKADGTFDYSVENQKAKSSGPIPEGVYNLDMSKVQHITSVDAIIGYFGKGGWPKSVPAWGGDRLWIDGSNYNRSGFSLHGGYTAGSAGCIDLLRNANPAIYNIQKATGINKSIQLIVKY